MKDLLAQPIFFNPIQPIDSIQKLIEALLKTAALVAFPIIIIFIIYAGFLFVSARGNEQQVTKAKSIITWAIIGGILILGAWAFATAIVEFFRTLRP